MTLPESTYDQTTACLRIRSNAKLTDRRREGPSLPSPDPGGGPSTSLHTPAWSEHPPFQLVKADLG